MVFQALLRARMPGLPADDPFVYVDQTRPISPLGRKASTVRIQKPKFQWPQLNFESAWPGLANSRFVPGRTIARTVSGPYHDQPC